MNSTMATAEAKKIQIITKLFEITLCGLAVSGLIIGLLAALSSLIYR